MAIEARYLNIPSNRGNGKDHAGAFDYVPDRDKPLGMRFFCPCGCGEESFMPFTTSGSPNPVWKWDGNKENPTLTPSVHNTGMPCKWHGFLRNGKWEEC
jgi:hypothetical protein